MLAVYVFFFFFNM